MADGADSFCRPDQPFFQTPFAKASVQNRALEATNYYHASIKGGVAQKASRHPADHSVVQIRNNTGANRRRGDVVEITGYLLTALDPDALWFAGGTPTLANPGWGIYRRPTKATEIGDCHVAGACIAYVNVIEAGHKYAELGNGQTVLQSATIGPVRILYKPSGTGEKECAVLIGAPGGAEVHIGKTDAPITKGNSGAVSRYTGAATSEAETTTTDTVKTKFANVAADKWCAYIKIDGTYYMLETERVQQTVCTDIQLDTATMKFQKKTRQVWLEPEAAETAWTDWHQGRNDCGA